MMQVLTLGQYSYSSFVTQKRKIGDKIKCYIWILYVLNLYILYLFCEILQKIDFARYADVKSMQNNYCYYR